MLLFIPSSDLSESANAATFITTLDYGFINVGESKTQSLRIGNIGNDALSYSLSVDADPAIVIEVSPDAGSLAGDEISDTTTISISPDLDAGSRSHAIELTALDSQGFSFRLTLSFVVVGVNEARSSQFPERSSPFTDNVSNVIFRVSEPLRLFRFEPIPFDATDRRIIIDTSRNRNIGGRPGGHGWITQNFAEKLSPLNDTWGYIRSEETIIGSFQNESIDVEVAFIRDNSMMTFTSTATLVVPAPFESVRTWALFSPENPPDAEQYKRTVYLFVRQGDTWALHNIFPRYRGNELSHYEIELIQVHKESMGSRDFYNPFAITYENNSDKPYAQYVSALDDLFPTLGIDGSGSQGAPNPSALNPSLAASLNPSLAASLNPSLAVTEPPPPPVDTAPEIIAAEEITSLNVRLTYDQTVVLDLPNVGSFSPFHVTLDGLRRQISGISQFSSTQIDLVVKPTGSSESGRFVDYEPTPDQIVSSDGLPAETQVGFPLV